MKPTPEQLRNRFMHHPPKDQAQIELHAEVSRRSLELAIWLTEVCPDGRQLSLALTDLESVRMRANSSIAGADDIALKVGESVETPGPIRVDGDQSFRVDRLPNGGTRVTRQS